MDRCVGAAALLPESDRKDLAVQALARSATISDLATRHGVSRKFVPVYAPSSADFCGQTFLPSNINVRELEQPVGHGCGADARPKEPRHHGGEIVSPVEAIFEFGEV